MELPLARRPVWLDVIAAGLIAAMRPRFDAAEVAVATDLRRAPVVADPDQVAQIVSVLLSDALRFTPPARNVAVASRSVAGGALVSVADTRIGVTTGERADVFDRLGRCRDPSFDDSGAGLFGMLQLVAAHRGALDVSNRPGGGAVFTVRLPREAHGKQA